MLQGYRALQVILHIIIAIPSISIIIGTCLVTTPPRNEERYKSQITTTDTTENDYNSDTNTETDLRETRGDPLVMST